MKRRYFIFTLILSAIGCFASHRQSEFEAEADKLAVLLDWKPGSTVADIGAGKGQMTLAAAERVQATGRVYATELDPEQLANLEGLASARRPHNITVVKGAVAETGLPAGCCDSILVRDVYHHFTDPAAMDASLFKSLRRGGQLAVIDFTPHWFLTTFYPVKGVPKNRGGHGVPRKTLIDELTSAGFQVVAGPMDWPDGKYCVVFRKPPQ